MDDTITLLKDALESIEFHTAGDEADETLIRRLREALAQPAQPPSTGNILLDAYNQMVAQRVAQPAQEQLDCNDCKHAERSELVGPCADCIPYFPARPLFTAKAAQPEQQERKPLILPEVNEVRYPDPYEDRESIIHRESYSEGWNDCLAEVERLNEGKKLTAHVATVQRLEAIHAGWLKENSPGGWIDGLRVANLELLEALKEFDALIKHRYTGTREAMSDLTYAAKRGAALIKKHGG